MCKLSWAGLFKCWLANTQHQQSSTVLLGFKQSFHKIKCQKEMNIKTDFSCLMILSRCFWTEWDWGTSPERQGAPTYLERTPLYFYFSPLLQTNTGCKLTEFLKPDFLVLRRSPVGILQRFQKVGETLEKAIPFLCSLHGSPSAQGRSVVLNTRPKFYLKAKISL